VRVCAVWVAAGLLAAGCSAAGSGAPGGGQLAAVTAQTLSCDAPLAGGEDTGSDPRPTLQDELDRATRSVDGGAVVALGRPGGAVRYCAAGRADTAGSPLLTDDVFRIASVSKTFVAVLVMQLVEEGRLTLETQVTDVLPELTTAEGISVRQLLNHTSGLADYYDASFEQAVRQDWDRTWTVAEVMERVSREARDFTPPGAKHRYSNTNYMVAGMIVEEITGRPLADTLRARITEPLGMTRTALAPDGPEPVTGFSPALPDGSTESVTYRSMESSAGAAGGIVSTAPDLVTFATALVEGQLVSPASYAEMTDFVDVGNGNGAGLGLFRNSAGQTGHEGTLHGYGALMIVPSAGGEVAVVLSNDTFVDLPELAKSVLTAP
jgi:D-alanyl-D-alanine carboxypeptidase